MKSSEFIDFQWADYEGLPMEDRFRIFETYLTTNKNLFESNNQNRINDFNNLYRYSVNDPVPNKKYIMAVIALMNDEIIVSQDTQIVEYISKHDNYYKVKLQDGRESEFPHKAIRDKLLMSIFLFDNIENYDKFRVEIIMFFDRGLPEFKEEDLMEDYQKVMPNNSVWMVAFTPKGDVRKQSATQRQTIRYYYKDEDNALIDAQRLQRAGHDVYTPVEVSSKNMAPYDKLREAINPNDTQHNPVGLKNWRELERAVKHRSSDANDPLHMARLNFGNQVIPLPKNGDMARLYKWVKNKLGNNKQREVFELLADPRLLDHLITSSRPYKSNENISEGKKRKSTRKSTRKAKQSSKALPRVYGGWWGFGGDVGYSGDGGGGIEEAKEEPQQPKEEPKVQLPPAHHAQKTQIPGTLPTYQKAFAMLNDWAPQGTTLDFGAGLGIGAKYMGSDTFEPFPRPGFQPTYTDSGGIRDGSYNRITNLNVLNVVPKDTRDNIVKEIGRILAPGGVAIITTRGKDVMGAKGEKGSEPMSIITSIGTYQKGFTKAELKGYIENILGKGFEVENVNLGPAGVAIRKLAVPLKKRRG